MYINGIHLANGPQSIDALVGYSAFTFLQGEITNAKALQAANPAALFVLRHYDPQFLKKDPADLAARIRRYSFTDVVPWNEANLDYEVGEAGKQFSPGWREANYARLADYWKRFVEAIEGGTANGRRKRLHFPAWSPFDGAVGPFWPGADVYDLHLYGSATAMLEALDDALRAIPDPTPVFVSEWNMGRPWSGVDAGEVQSFLDGLAARPRVIGATAFIWKWHNPSPKHPNLDLHGTHAAQVIKDWRYHSAKALSPAIVEDLPEAFQAWLNAGGWKNFAAYLIATGQVQATDEEKREILRDRLSSATNEALIYLT